MKITIQNFRGLSDLEAPVAPLLLLAGSNAAGKTSACTAIAAVASGVLLPFDGLTKGKAALIVHDGAERAQAVITTEEGAAAASWPAVERSTQGRFRDASAVAVGLEDLTALKPVERAGRLIQLIGAEPTEHDLIEAMGNAEVPAEYTPAVWNQIAKGWDAAHEHYKTEGAKLKGQWEKLTGDRFGATKALTWRPKDWALALEGESVDFLEANLKVANEALAHAQQQAGADRATVEALTRDAAMLASSRQAATDAQVDLDSMQKALVRAEKAFHALGEKPKVGKPPLTCPCCQQNLRLVSGTLVEAQDEDPDEIAAAIAHYEEAEATWKKARDSRDMAQRYLDAARNKVQAAESATAKLKSMPEASETAETDIAAARTKVERHNRNLLMKGQVIEAMKLTQRITQHIAIVGMLDKGGLRQKVLVERLGAFNGKLVDNSGTAGWAPVHIDADMAISYGGRLLSMCSGGEQFRTRVTLQLTIAQVEEAPIVIVDGADILDKAGRNGLFALIRALGIPAVIGMTILRENEMPNLAKAGIGNSVWIEGGRAAEATQVAA
jgi:hypothetical protein